MDCQPINFESLIEQAKRLSLKLEEDDAAEPSSSLRAELPRIDRTISQVLSAAEELHKRVNHDEENAKRANLLLSSRGIEMGILNAKLEEITENKDFKMTGQIKYTTSDMYTFLKNEPANLVQQVIDDFSKECGQVKSSDLVFDSLICESNAKKSSLLNTFIGPSQNYMNLKMLLDHPNLMNYTITSKFDADACGYCKVVTEYNDIQLGGGIKPDLMQNFTKVAGASQNEKVRDMWALLEFMTEIEQPRVLETWMNRQLLLPRIERAIQYLENRYCKYLALLIGKEWDSESENVAYLISTTVKYKLKPKKMNDISDYVFGQPLWTLVYYSLRCGAIEAAIQILQQSEDNEIFAEVLRQMFIEKIPEISKELTGELVLRYKQSVEKCPDQFKKLSYCVVLGFDPQLFLEDIVNSLDDFLWFRLTLIRRGPPYLLSNYVDLQRFLIDQHGEKFFMADGNSHNYFQAMVLTGQFEVAVEFLARCDTYLPHAVHMALALNERGLLLKSRTVDQPMLYVDIEDPRPLRRLNLIRLLRLYVSCFQVTKVEEALEYYYFLRDYLDTELRDYFLVCVIDVAIASGAFVNIFGKRDEKGQLKGGFLERFKCESNGPASVVGDKLVASGKLEDAVLNYDIAGEYDKAVLQLCILITNILAKPTWTELSLYQRHLLNKMIKSFDKRLKKGKISVDVLIVDKFRTISSLWSFFKYVQDKRYDLALDVLTHIKLVPKDFAQLEESLKHFNDLSGEIQKIHPNILILSQNTYYARYKQLCCVCGANALSGPRLKSIAELRERANALITMVGSLPYRLPQKTMRYLLDIEAQMH